MGTPEFAAPAIDTLIDAGHEIAAVFSQPDKPKGRGYTMTPPPVKVKAMEHGIPVYQPASMRDGEAHPRRRIDRIIGLGAPGPQRKRHLVERHRR